MDNAIAFPLPLAHDPAEVRVACPADELEWARAAGGGDKSAFGRMVERHKSAVFGVCYRLLGAPGGPGTSDEARDAAQEAFVRAYTAIGRFDPRQPFGAWVLRIARNHCIDLLRRRRPTLALVSEARGEEGPEAGTSAEPADPFAGTGESAMQELEAQRDLDAAVARLPPRYREVIALFHLQHKSYAEIAEILRIPLGTVMTWLHRARKELKAQLSEHFS
ncbi:MAG: RNA polymerase sigma factor SigW [Myxococcales bacterium]